ncbi:hypothetical protein EDC96DRAFT_539378 [Choanephora cucurbitarum]|nr:hypothetical protein EDC96DRAFT_539378 [Choanephora cucurbitarum]
MIVNVNRKAKTEPRYIGPFTIKGWARSGANILEDLTDQRSQSDLAEKHYKVQAIVNHHGSGKNIKYYVHRRGYDDQSKYNTWEPASSFDSLKSINKYWARRNVANAVTRGTRKDSSTKRSNRRSARNNTGL